MNLSLTNLQIRVISGAVGILITVALFSLGAWGFLSWLTGICLLGIREFAKLLHANGLVESLGMASLSAMCVAIPGIGVASGVLPLTFLWVLIVAWVVSAIVLLFRQVNNPIQEAGTMLLLMIYVPLPMACYAGVAFITGEFSMHLAVGVISLLWASDSGAYFAGKFLGRHKLFERISPKKTWEGFFGGWASSLAVAYFWQQFSPILTESLHWYALATLIAVVGTLGDLVESMFKRQLNIKDSGQFLPGHGGVLDRFDGLLMAAPMVYIYLWLIIKL